MTDQAVAQDPVQTVDSPDQVSAFVTRLTSASQRVDVMLALARQKARDVQLTQELEVAALTRAAQGPHGARKVIGQAAGDAAQALADLTAALTEAEVIRRQGLDLLARRRALHASIADSTELAHIDSAEALAASIQTIQVPLVELDGRLQDAQRVVPAISASLVRRLAAAAIAARATWVAETTDRLQALERMTMAVHDAVLAGPDPVVGLTTDLLAPHADVATLPQVRLPKWSAQQSGQPKGSWRGWPFDTPTLDDGPSQS